MVPTAMLQCHGQGRGVNRQCVVVVAACQKLSIHTLELNSLIFMISAVFIKINVGDTNNSTGNVSLWWRLGRSNQFTPLS